VVGCGGVACGGEGRGEVAEDEGVGHFGGGWGCGCGYVRWFLVDGFGGCVWLLMIDCGRCIGWE